MCDLFAALGVKDGKVLREFMVKGLDTIQGKHTPHGKGRNNDGIGYTAVTDSKKIFGERWFDPADAFKGATTTEADRQLFQDYADIMEDIPKGLESETYNSFGKQEWDKVTSVLYHARMSTNNKSMENVHPFNTEDGKISLIHNGVIKNADEFEKRYSTCDSEGILTQYVKRNVHIKKNQVKNLFQDLDGAFTVMVTAFDGNGNRIVDIFKDSGRKLYFTIIDQLADPKKGYAGLVFASNPEIIKKACDGMGWTHKNNIVKVKDNMFMRFDALSGRSIKKFPCEPRRSLPDNSKGNQSAHNARHWGHHGPVWPGNEYDEGDWSAYDNLTTGTNTNESSTDTNAQKPNTNSEGRKKHSHLVDSLVGTGLCLVAKFLVGADSAGDDGDSISDNNSTVDNSTASTEVDDIETTSENLTDKLNNVIQLPYNNAILEATDSKYNVSNQKFTDLLDEEASDSKYGAEFEVMSDADIAILNDYEKELSADEQDALGELPRDIALSFLKTSYESNIGPL